MKDWLLSIFGDWIVGRRIAPYGKMTSFHIDTHNKKITLTAELRGETEPIDLALNYERHEVNGQESFQITNVQVSREWMNELANTMLKQMPQTFPVPEGIIGAAIKMLKL